jgi:hypothetical protein
METGFDDPEPSLLSTDSPNGVPRTRFYMDDIFRGFKTFEDAYTFLRDHFLPRLLWSMLKLSFKKLKLFMGEIMAPGILHKAGGILQTKPSRSKKIRTFPVPKDASGVRRFIGAVGITRRWIRNFAKPGRPLSRLTGDVEWRWGESEHSE